MVISLSTGLHQHQPLQAKLLQKMPNHRPRQIPALRRASSASFFGRIAHGCTNHPTKNLGLNQVYLGWNHSLGRIQESTFDDFLGRIIGKKHGKDSPHPTNIDPVKLGVNGYVLSCSFLLEWANRRVKLSPIPSQTTHLLQHSASQRAYERSQKCRSSIPWWLSGLRTAPPC